MAPLVIPSCARMAAIDRSIHILWLKIEEGAILIEHVAGLAAPRKNRGAIYMAPR